MRYTSIAFATLLCFASAPAFAQQQPAPQQQSQPQRSMEAPGVSKSTLDAQKQFELVKKKNLAHRWVVKAQAVCTKGTTCQIESVREQQRLPDGSARFVIAYRSRSVKGTGGNFGTADIVCGFNRSNKIQSTSVNAVCQ